MQNALCFDGLPFDPFSLFQNDFSPSEVDVGRGHVLFAMRPPAVVRQPKEMFSEESITDQRSRDFDQPRGRECVD